MLPPRRDLCDEPYVSGIRRKSSASEAERARVEQLVIDGHLPDPGWKASRLWTDSYLRSVAACTASHCPLQVFRLLD